MTPPKESTSGRQPLIGKPRVRREDARFLRGAGRYTDDLAATNAAHAVVVRSPYAHAMINGIDTDNAQRHAGVIGVLTANDIRSDVVSDIPSMNNVPPYDVRNDDGELIPDGSQPVLARDRVRYAGQPIAFVVADTVRAARDAAEDVLVDYEPLDALMTFAAATHPDSAPIWPELPSNRTLNLSLGDRASVDELFDNAAHTVTCEVENNRIVPNFMEPRSALGEFDIDSDRYTLHTGCQSTHGIRAGLSIILGVEAERIRVVAPDTGGGFGARNLVYAEFVLSLIAARRFGRPVKWTATRDESFLTDAQARDQVLRGELAVDDDGRFLAVRATMHWRHGGYFGPRNAAVVSRYFPPNIGSVYRIPSGHIVMHGAFTNTTPHAAYRGIGRMEANYLMERLVDRAADQLEIDPITLRRRNFVHVNDMPWTAAGGARYTSGEFETNLDRALALADYDQLEARRHYATARGRLLGFGVGMYIENDGSSPSEFADVSADEDGKVTVAVGTQDFGMGHETIYAQIAADTLGLDVDDINIAFGDTDRVRIGFGSAGSRSARLGGSAVVKGGEAFIDKAKSLAADKFETAVDDISYDNGALSVSGTDRVIGLSALAQFAKSKNEALQAEAQFDSDGDVHSNGCHVCEVEVDPETGVVTVLRHILIADVGRAINPLIVAGQLHGGIAQGLGQAGLEQVVYDNGSGQTLTGSYMDYTLPRADDFPMFTTELNEVIEADNPLGVKGAGEGPTTGSPAAMVNAVIDALSPLGVKHIDMPLTPFRVWSTIDAARTASQR